MNEAARGCNRGVVLSWREIAAGALVAGCAALASGCAAARAEGLTGLAPGTTAIRVVNHVGAPDALDRLTIDVDGQTIPLAAIPPNGADPAFVARLHLPAGPHTIAVRARAHAQRSDVVVVGANQPFHVGRGPAAITVDVRGAASDDAGAQPVSVRLSIEGGHMSPEIGAPLPEARDAACRALLPIPRAICRAAVELDDATRKNDIVAALCVRDKLAEMRRLALAGESGRGDAPALAEAEIASLSAQVDRCAGTYLPAEPDGVRVIRPGR